MFGAQKMDWKFWKVAFTSLRCRNCRNWKTFHNWKWSIPVLGDHFLPWWQCTVNFYSQLLPLRDGSDCDSQISTLHWWVSVRNDLHEQILYFFRVCKLPPRKGTITMLSGLSIINFILFWVSLILLDYRPNDHASIFFIFSFISDEWIIRTFTIAVWDSPGERTSFVLNNVAS